MSEQTVIVTEPLVRVNPNGFLYMFRWWPHPLRYDGEVFAYSWLGFWWRWRGRPDGGTSAAQTGEGGEKPAK